MITIEQLSAFKSLPRQKRIKALEILQEQQRRASRRKILTYFPDTGPLRRELYSKHCDYFEAGSTHRERLMLAANRVGKTEGVGGYEMALHLTGQYPNWWKGRKFDHGVKAWAAGDTGKTVREILQSKLLGPVGAWGTGLIPGDSISRIVRGTGGVADTVEIVYCRHVSGSDSMLIFKSYDQRREAFQGTEQDIIWLDEEPSLDIYTECLMRTMTNNGMIMLTFTPLLGMSDVVCNSCPMAHSLKVQRKSTAAQSSWRRGMTRHICPKRPRTSFGNHCPHSSETRAPKAFRSSVLVRSTPFLRPIYLWIHSRFQLTGRKATGWMLAGTVRRRYGVPMIATTTFFISPANMHDRRPNHRFMWLELKPLASGFLDLLIRLPAGEVNETDSSFFRLQAAWFASSIGRQRRGSRAV